jgi:CheY-like chemotaxis protein
LKFTERGNVGVTLNCLPGAEGRIQAHIDVCDTGTGIPAAKLSEIFEKFTQADTSITRKYGGTGLGLAITKRLVEMHGGTIHVQSELARGSTFNVNLEFDAAPAALLTPARKPGRSTLAGTIDPNGADKASEAARVLLVEDNPVNQRLALTVLKKKGYTVEVATNGREAIDKIDSAATQYDIVLMDVQMPVLDGLETTRLLRLNPKWKDLPIIAMTAHAMTGDRERCLEAGMSGYISKPVQAALLIATVEEFLARPAAL